MKNASPSWRVRSYITHASLGCTQPMFLGADIQFRRSDRLDVCVSLNHPIALCVSSFFAASHNNTASQDLPPRLRYPILRGQRRRRFRHYRTRCRFRKPNGRRRHRSFAPRFWKMRIASSSPREWSHPVARSFSWEAGRFQLQTPFCRALQPHR